jgi:hypothetical protein
LVRNSASNASNASGSPNPSASVLG